MGDASLAGSRNFGFGCTGWGVDVPWVSEAAPGAADCSSPSCSGRGRGGRRRRRRQRWRWRWSSLSSSASFSARGTARVVVAAPAAPSPSTASSSVAAPSAADLIFPSISGGCFRERALSIRGGVPSGWDRGVLGIFADWFVESRNPICWKCRNVIIVVGGVVVVIVGFARR